MKYKFEKSKYPIFKIAFYILLFCSLFLFLMIAKNNAYKITIKGISPVLKPISVNVDFIRNTNDRIFVCFDNYCKPLESNSFIAQKAGFSYVASVSFDREDKEFFNTKIKNVYFALPKNMKKPENKIEKVVLYLANEAHHYKFEDIKKLEKKTVSLAIDGIKELKEYDVYTFKNSSNYVGLKNHLMTLTLSLICKIKLYIFPYCWLFISLLIFLFNKDAFKYSFKTKGVILCYVFSFVFIVMLFIYCTLPKEKTDLLGDYVLNDVEKYAKTHKVQVITRKNKKHLPELNDIDIAWHYLDLEKDKLGKIDKEEFAKNDIKTIIYFDSDSIDIGAISLFSARAKIYYTNDGAIGKLTYN